jgi:hypothetical protein
VKIKLDSHDWRAILDTHQNNSGDHEVSAAALINEVSPFLASVWTSKPFSRPTVVSALFEKMKADGNEDAYRVRVLLHRYMDALK